MVSLFDGWFGRSPQAGDSEWSTDTSVCASCGRLVELGELGEPYYAVVRNMERITADGMVDSEIGDDLAHTHLGCWPKDLVEIVADVNYPDKAQVRGVTR